MIEYLKTGACMHATKDQRDCTNSPAASLCHIDVDRRVYNLCIIIFIFLLLSFAALMRAIGIFHNNGKMCSRNSS